MDEEEFGVHLEDNSETVHKGLLQDDDGLMKDVVARDSQLRERCVVEAAQVAGDTEVEGVVDTDAAAVVEKSGVVVLEAFGIADPGFQVFDQVVVQSKAPAEVQKEFDSEGNGLEADLELVYFAGKWVEEEH